MLVVGDSYDFFFPNTVTGQRPLVSLGKSGRALTFVNLQPRMCEGPSCPSCTGFWFYRWSNLGLAVAASLTCNCFLFHAGISSCAAGWFYHGSSCYGYFRKPRSWSDAEVRKVASQVESLSPLTQSSGSVLGSDRGSCLAKGRERRGCAFGLLDIITT